MAAPNCLNVIALISGGKDSLFSLLHILANGHKVIALANLYPPLEPAPTEEDGSNGSVDDINSYMYQTVGHTVIPLYSDALDIPLYRDQIRGGAVDAGKEYRYNAPEHRTAAAEDETESLIPLLRRIMYDHPAANAVSTGAILSDYQRTRVESVAIRLGLTPLSYLWQYPHLWGDGTAETKLLDDMRAVGQVAKIIKVASGGLDSRFLWADVADVTVGRILVKTMGRFGTVGTGAVLGEGGEYETLAIEGPKPLWKKSIEIEEEERVVIEGGGGSAFLMFKGARLVEKNHESLESGYMDGPRGEPRLPRPNLLDTTSEDLLKSLQKSSIPATSSPQSSTTPPTSPSPKFWSINRTHHSLYISNMAPSPTHPLHAQTALTSILTDLISLLTHSNTDTSSITHTTVLLRSVNDFAAVNKSYNAFFPHPLPPARATFACGDRLPDGINIMLSVIIDLGPRSSRGGLHVQSRSYWAPANIGPYSQAISSPLPKVGGHDDTSTPDSLVYVAGQIPLEPGTMEIPVHQNEGNREDGNREVIEEGEFKFQAVLSLQHLWRIGQAMGVKWWVGCVALIARSEFSRQRANIAGEIWRGRNLASLILSKRDEEAGDGVEETEGPDLWDRTFGGARHDLGGSGTGEKTALPDFSLVHFPTGQPAVAPPFFAAEVDSLPRNSLIEWSSLGISGPNKMEITLSTPYGASGRTTSRSCWSTVSLKGTRLTYVTILQSEEHTDLWKEIKEVVGRERSYGSAEFKQRMRILHIVCYTKEEVNWESVWDPEILRSMGGQEASTMVVPCYTVWSEDGQEVRAGLAMRSEMLEPAATLLTYS